MTATYAQLTELANTIANQAENIAKNVIQLDEQKTLKSAISLLENNIDTLKEWTK